MRSLSTVMLVTVVIIVAGTCAAQGEARSKEPVALDCTLQTSPLHSCIVHEEIFEAVEIPIAYGLPAPGFLTVGSVEYLCRYSLAKKEEFPNTAPRSVSGGCIVMKERVEFRCACTTCTSAEREWRESYRTRKDVTPYLFGEIAEPASVETDLYLRIQELRVFAEDAVADCLQEKWEYHFADE